MNYYTKEINEVFKLLNTNKKGLSKNDAKLI